MNSTNFQGLWSYEGAMLEDVEHQWELLIKQVKESNPDVGWGLVSFEGWCRPTASTTLPELAARLDNIFLKPEILLVIRHPVDWLASCYQKTLWTSLENGTVGGDYELRSLASYYNCVRSDSARYFGYGGLDPMSIVSAFGVDRVRIIPLEHLVETNFHAIHDLYPDWNLGTYRGSRLNFSRDTATLFLARCWHRLPISARNASRKWLIDHSALLERMFGWYRPAISIKKSHARQILREYAENLDDLQALCPVDLRELGYTEWPKR